jgi:hypothetical protein
MTHIFVSHAAADGSTIANDLVAQLETQGQTCWIAPRNLVAGQTYPAQIMRALEASSGVVLVLTPGANASGDVLQEVQIAHARRKTIVPFVVDRTAPGADLGYFLSVRQQVQWTSPREAAAAVMRSLGIDVANARDMSAPGTMDAVSAIEAAARSEDGVSGRFILTVQSTGVDDGGHWLNSEADYRDPRNLGIAIAPAAASALAARLGCDPLEQFAGRRICVTGTAKKVRIVFFVGGRASDRYYFQTHVAIDDPGQIEDIG